MNLSGNQLLARSIFSDNQYTGVSPGNSFYYTENFLDTLVFSNNSCSSAYTLLKTYILSCKPALFYSISYRKKHPFHINGLLDKIESAELCRFHCCLNCSVT